MPFNALAERTEISGPTLDPDQYEMMKKAISAIDRGHTLHGLITLEHSPTLRAIPVVNSYVGYCMAKERGEIREAVELCQVALQSEPRNPIHYLNLGRIYLLAGDKGKAIATFWKGISKAPGAERGVVADVPRNGNCREHALILDELRRLGIRKRVAFASLHRSHPLNRIAGKLMASFGRR